MAARHRDLDDFARHQPASATLAVSGYGATGALPIAGLRPHASLGSSMLRALARAAVTVLHWQRRSRERCALSELSDYMLCDIGISRAEAIGEAAKPFWRG